MSHTTVRSHSIVQKGSYPARSFFCILLSLCLALSVSLLQITPAAEAATDSTSELTYTIADGKASVTASSTMTPVVPATLGGAPVTSVTLFGIGITTLDVSAATSLTSLRCGGNQLTTLDVSHNTELTTLYCQSNNLSNLDISRNNSLTSLNCNNSRSTSIPAPERP